MTKEPEKVSDSPLFFDGKRIVDFSDIDISTVFKQLKPSDLDQFKAAKIDKNDSESHNALRKYFNNRFSDEFRKIKGDTRKKSILSLLNEIVPYGLRNKEM